MIERPDRDFEFEKLPDSANLPTRGEDIIAEVERLKRQPVRFRCLGMSLGFVAILAALAWLIWLALT